MGDGDLDERSEGSDVGRDSVAASPGSRVGPFLAGTLLGGVAGAVAGTLLSERTRTLLVGLIHLTGRDLSRSEREQLRFELLEQ